MARGRAETCRWQKLCKVILTIKTFNKLCLTIFYLYILWNPMNFGALHVISGFRRKLEENRALLGYYAAYSGKFLSVFRDTLSVPSSGVDGTDMVSRNVGKKLQLHAAFWWIHQSIFLPTENTLMTLPTSKCEYSPLPHSTASWRLERLAFQGPETLHHRHIYSADNRERKQQGWTLCDTSLLCPYQQRCLSSIPSYTAQTTWLVSAYLRAIISPIYRVSQEECARLRESVPYVKVYPYNPKHLYPKFERLRR